MIKIENAQVSTGIWIEYSLSGIENDETLVFVHGLGANLRQFELQQQFFAKDYRVLLVSLRGHGGSSAPPRSSTGGLYCQGTIPGCAGSSAASGD